MKLDNVRAFCNEFYRRFSALKLQPLQLKLFDSDGSVSIALVKKNESEDIEAAVTINQDTVSLLKINSFENIDTFFTFVTPLELYTNLLTLLIMCCHASGVIISPSEALNVTLGLKINTWCELIIYICSLSPEGKRHIAVQENRQNALKFLKTTFHVIDGMLITDGLYKSQIKYKDLLELIRAVLDSMCAVLKMHGYEIDPFRLDKIRDMSGAVFIGSPVPAPFLNGPHCPYSWPH